MNTLSAWAAQWGISSAAMDDLRRRLVSSAPAVPNDDVAVTENALVPQIRLNAARLGKRLFRNNVGAGKLENGSFVRWGLCNESAALNKSVKSSDLIGISPVLITPAHIGHTLGVFLAREVKRPEWKYAGTPREEAQLNFIKIIQGLGGDARFTASPGGDL